MKVVAVLKHPNIDVIADVDEELYENYQIGDINEFSPIMTNIFVVQWIDKYVKMIPFKAAKNLVINMPFDNIAMMFEADDKLAKIHSEEVRKEIAPFVSESEYQEMIRKNQEKVQKTLSK